MICPRCGVVNAPERGSCVRCSGSLAPPQQRDDRPLPPVVPMTKRAELKSGRPGGPVAAGAGGSALGPAAAPQSPSGQGMPNPSVVNQGAAGEPLSADLYLLSTERSTGQPAPPGVPLNQSERLPADRPGRLAVGLSRA